MGTVRRTERPHPAQTTEPSHRAGYPAHPGSDQPAADVPSNGTTGNDAQTSGKGDAGQKNTAVKTGDSSSGVYAELMLLSLAMGCAGIYLKKKEKNR